MDMNRAHDLPGLLHCFGLHPAVLDRLVLRSGAIYGVKSGAGAGGDGFLGIYEVYSNHQKVELSIVLQVDSSRKLLFHLFGGGYKDR